MGKIDYFYYNLPLSGKLLQKPLLKELFKTESLGYSKGHGGHRNYGDQGIEGKGRRPQMAFILSKSTCGQEEDS